MRKISLIAGFIAATAILFCGCVKNNNDDDGNYYVVEGYRYPINTAGVRVYWVGEKQYYDLMLCEDAGYKLGSDIMPRTFFMASLTPNIAGSKHSLITPDDGNFFFAADRNGRGYKFDARFRDSAGGNYDIKKDVMFYSGDQHYNAELGSGTFRVALSGSSFSVEIDATMNGYDISCRYSGTPVSFKYEDL